MTVIVTGAAGFIGAALCARLLERGEEVVGLDEVNAYYDPGLKEARLARLIGRKGFSFVRADIADAGLFAQLAAKENPSVVVHLAAQAGVRYSIENPFAYERSNLAGHLSVLEACRHAPSRPRLVYASSSSVYGDRPAGKGFSESDAVDHPVSLYAATKRSGELMSGTYCHLYGMSATGLRFFTVYGPWGRPDMAYFSFTRKIYAGEPIDVYGEGRMARDFTYIDDILDGILGVIDHPGAAGEHRLFNIGDSSPVGLMRMIEILEKALGRTAIKTFLPMQPGDVTKTFADISRLTALCGYQPKAPLEEGLARFAAWYKDFYRV